MTLRDAKRSDLDAVLALEQACYPAPQAYTRQDYRYTLGPARAVNLMLEEEGRLIGFIGAFHHKGHRVGNVYTINVHPDARGRGLGRLLLAACEERLKALGIRRVILEVNVANAHAIALYERCEYRLLERLKDYYVTYAERDALRYGKALT